MNLIGLLQKDFGYLFDAGFVVSSSKEDQRLSSVEFTSQDFQIEFEALDGVLNISIKHAYPLEKKKGRWHNLFTYVELFEGHVIEFPERVTVESNDVALLSDLLSRYMGKLKDFNRVGTCESNEEILRKIGTNISERNWKKLGL